MPVRTVRINKWFQNRFRLFILDSIKVFSNTAHRIEIIKERNIRITSWCYNLICFCSWKRFWSSVLEDRLAAERFAQTMRRQISNGSLSFFVWCEVLCGITFCPFVVTCIAYAAHCMLSSIPRIVWQFALIKLLDRHRWAANDKPLREYIVLENSSLFHFIILQKSSSSKEIWEVLEYLDQFHYENVFPFSFCFFFLFINRHFTIF